MKDINQMTYTEIEDFIDKLVNSEEYSEVSQAFFKEVMANEEENN